MDDAAPAGRTPVDNFAVAVRVRLAFYRREGLTFESAWARVMEEIRPRDRKGWGSLDPARVHWTKSGNALWRADGEESAILFLKRWMREAYARRGPNFIASLDPWLST